MKIALGLFTFLVFFAYGVYKWLDVQQFGRAAREEDHQKFLKSPNYDAETRTFKNKVPGEARQDMKFWTLLEAYMFGKEVRVPGADLPAMPPDFESFLKPDPERIKWIWLGHSTIYLNIHGTFVLIDPVFAAASPVSFLVKRFQSPIVGLAQLPRVDVIVLSHDHYDHMEATAIRFLAGASSRFLVPLGLKSKLRGWGVAPDRVDELDWHDTISFQGVSFTAAPAQHFSGRGIFDANKTQWAGWIVGVQNSKIFYSGDTGFSQHFKEIGDRYGPFDLAFLECGQYNPMWRYVHMLPEEVLQAAKDLRAANVSPVHWGTFNLSLHDWFEPIERISQLTAQEKIPLWHPKVGEIAVFPGQPQHEAWWREHPDVKARIQDSAAVISQ